MEEEVFGENYLVTTAILETWPKKENKTFLEDGAILLKLK